MKRFPPPEPYLELQLQEIARESREREDKERLLLGLALEHESSPPRLLPLLLEPEDLSVVPN
jgi:hypothetical protein